MKPAFYSIILIIAICSGGIAGFFFGSIEIGTNMYLLEEYKPSAPTKFYDRKNRVFSELYKHKRNIIPFDAIPTHVVQAFLAVEDEAFFSHKGIDLLAIARAAIKNVKAGRIVQGGSTLTQQLAKQLYLAKVGSRGRNIKQKIKETLFALQLEHALSKTEILEVFFNAIYLGHGCQGLDCAARLYFRDSIHNLDIGQAVLLARLPRSPILYSPLKNPKRSLRNHKQILDGLERKGYLAKNMASRIHQEFWHKYWPVFLLYSPSRNIQTREKQFAPYFVDYIRQIVEKLPGIEYKDLYGGGLQVYTTLDIDHQRIAQEAFDAQISSLQKRTNIYARSAGNQGLNVGLFDLYNSLSQIFAIPALEIPEININEQYKQYMNNELLAGLQMLIPVSPGAQEKSAIDYFTRQAQQYDVNLKAQGAFLSIEPKTGYITAMIGGSEFSPINQFNRAIASKRQVGSAFKIFVYGAALAEGLISTQTPILDAPISIVSEKGTSWVPGNYSKGYKGTISASRAFALSSNIGAVQVLLQLGPKKIAEFATKLMKIHSQKIFHLSPSLALGTTALSPLEMGTAVAIIANEGKEVFPFAIRMIKDKHGKILYNQEEIIQNNLDALRESGEIQVIKPAVAKLIGLMMREVADRGTARKGLRDTGKYSGHVAAKTGTTSNYSDAWLLAFNPEYSVTSWFGFDKSRISLGPGSSGGSVAAPVVGQFLHQIYEEMGQNPPRFNKLFEPALNIAGIIPSACNGFALKVKPSKVPLKQPTTPDIDTQEGTLIDPGIFQEGPCKAQEIKTERNLIMEAFGITQEELEK